MRTGAAQRDPVSLDDLGDRLFAAVPEVAAVFRWDERTVRKAIRAGEMPGIRAGSTWRVPVAWLRQAAGQGAQGAA